jgi:ribosomal protein S18 acetylase RimI-like enzyme
VSVDEHGLVITRLPQARLPEAVALLSRGMRDNPNNIAAFGADPRRRERCLRRLFAGLFAAMRQQQPLCALNDGRLVGVGGVAPPGGCQPTGRERLRIAPSILLAGPRSARRVLRWTGAWAKRDPNEPHVHLGPLAVEPRLQGMGIGSRILTEHCSRLDERGEVGYLETDKPENVVLYERFGYEVIAEAEIIGVRNWFALRPKQQGTPSLVGESRATA